MNCPQPRKFAQTVPVERVVSWSMEEFDDKRSDWDTGLVSKLTCGASLSDCHDSVMNWMSSSHISVSDKVHNSQCDIISRCPGLFLSQCLKSVDGFGKSGPTRGKTCCGDPNSLSPIINSRSSAELSVESLACLPITAGNGPPPPLPGISIGRCRGEGRSRGVLAQAAWRYKGKSVCSSSTVDCFSYR